MRRLPRAIIENKMGIKIDSKKGKKAKMEKVQKWAVGRE